MHPSLHFPYGYHSIMCQQCMLPTGLPMKLGDELEQRNAVQDFLFPAKEELPDDFEMPIWDHLEELRERVMVGALAAAASILVCFCFSKDLVLFLEAPVAETGVRFLQLSPGEFFFTTLKVGLPQLDSVSNNTHT